MTRANLYDRVAEEAASVVIRRYSTSFGLASRLLDSGVRQHVENIYALVRLADEIVDGEAVAAGLTPLDAAAELDALERETDHALATGYSTNLIVHAFALTAREAGFGAELTAPFYESMRTDLTATEHDRASFERYVYGSAEVVGLMCLRAFLLGHTCSPDELERLEKGARALGAAFQKVNFLRDLSADFRELGRSYFPGIRVDSFSEDDKNRLLDDIDGDLAVAASVIPDLPAGSRRAVALAQGLFTELAARLRVTPASRLVSTRIRVPNPIKLRIAARAALGRIPKHEPGSMSSVIVIGGGISGLASAALLAREGHEVTLLEAHPTLGGRAGSWEKDGFRFDTGPSWYLMPEVFDHFYKLLGTSAAEQLNLVTLDPGYRVYFEGFQKPIDVAASRAENIQLFESVRRGSGRRLARYLDSAQATYDLAKKYFLYTTFRSILPYLRGEVLGKGARFIRLLVESLWSKARRTVRDDRLRKILAYPAVFLGSSPYTTPSMYHLMSHLDLSEGVLYPVGGFARVIESIVDLAVAEGVTIIPSARATRIVVENGKATGVDYVDARARPHTLAADLVVSAVDLHFSETELLEPEQRTYPEQYWEHRTPGPSALLLNLGVTGDLPELEHHNLLFAKDWRGGFDAIFGSDPRIPSPASLYVCKPSGIDPDVAPDNTENLFVLVPIPADPGFGKGGVGGRGDKAVEALADTVIAQIADWAGIPNLASRVTVRRTVGPADFANDLNAWRGTALGPAHTLRQSAFFRAGNKSRRVRGLYFAGGSTIPGIGLPMCLISAEVLLKRIHNDTSTTPMAEPIERPGDA